MVKSKKTFINLFMCLFLISFEISAQEKNEEVPHLIKELIKELDSAHRTGSLLTESRIEFHTSKFDELGYCDKFSYAKTYLTSYYLSKNPAYQCYPISLHLVMKMSEITGIDSSLSKNVFGYMYLYPEKQIPKDLQKWEQQLSCK